MSARTPAEKIEYYRDEIKALTARKIELLPAFEARESIVADARQKLAGINPLASEANRKHCLIQHDRIVKVSAEHGRAYTEYRETIGMIKTLTGEIERLELKVAA